MEVQLVDIQQNHLILMAMVVGKKMKNLSYSALI